MENNQEAANNVGQGKQDKKILQKWKQSSLDEDIEKFFEPTDKESIKDVFLSSSETPTEKHRYDEADYKMHRGKSFPHMHQPLKALHSRPSKRHRTSSRPSQTDLAESTKLTSSASTPSTPFSTSTDDKPLIPFDGNKASVHKKVGFYVGEQAQGSMESFSDPLDSERQRLGSIATDDKASLVQSPKRVVQIRQLSQEESSSPRSPSISLSIPSHDSAASTPVINEQFHFSPDESSEPKVKFELGQDLPDYEQDGEGAKESEEKDTKHRHRHKHRHHHHHHKHRGQEDLAWRQRAGTEMELPETLKRVPTELEEAITLNETHLNLMASHRFEDVRGMRRHKIQPKSSVSSFVHIGRKDGEGQPIIGTPGKKTFDHRPHEVFVELDELYKTEGEELGWKETARWIKYEEDLEEGAHRWGKPHVATLSFHSLLNLRKCLEQGTVLLDLEEKELPGIAYRLTEAMVIDDQIKPENKSDVMRMLLLRHKHVSDHKQFQFTGLRKNFSSNISSTSLASLNDEKKIPKVSSFATPSEDINSSAMTPLMMTAKEDGKVDERKQSIPENSTIDVKDFESSSVHSQEDSKKPTTLAIMKKIPEDAEATIVLVGAVDFLDEPTISFVRLSEGLMLPLLLEVPIPIRFMFVLLGPVSNEFDYHEIGRSISTLMSDQKFHNVAYKAEEKRDLLRAINEFLDESIVLPPGDWESKTLLPIQAIQRKSLQLRQRKKSRRKEAEAALTDEKYHDDPLRRTGRMFGGFINEIKRRYSRYLSDFKDALNPQCLAAVVFIYFAALSGAISFGGLLADKTENLIGVSETLIITAVCGILFSLLSAQPLMIIGVTGPVLLFDESLYSFCISNDIEFLSLRVWISFWVAIITTVVVAFEGSFFLRFFTRFTEEILGALISLIFIYESVMKLVEIFQRHPLLASHCDFIANKSVYANRTSDSNITSSVFEALTAVSPDLNNVNMSTTVLEVLTTMNPDIMVKDNMDQLPRNQPNTALLSMILMLSTFFIAYYLREFRNGKYLGRTARRALGDFGVPIAIVIIVLLDYSIKDTFTQKLQVPEGLSPSRPEIRGWIISPLGVQRPIQIWLIFASILPAILLFIMLFMEIQICELIINKKERQLKKGTGYHVDILIMSYINILCGVTGSPWLSAAIVRAISHIMSLTVMSRTHAPGEKSHILEVKEQRLTNFLVSLLVGMSVGMAPLLRLIPVAVLFGVFIYMGVVSMTGVQFFERLQLMLMPVKHHPDASFVRNVRTWKMHLFTIIQLLCLILLWAVKSTEAAIALPFVLLLMIPIRGQLTLFFTEEELKALDGKEAELEDEDEEPDFYEEALLPG